MTEAEDEKSCERHEQICALFHQVKDCQNKLSCIADKLNLFNEMKECQNRLTYIADKLNGMAGYFFGPPLFKKKNSHLTISVGPELFQFSSKEDWIEHAQKRFQQARVFSGDTICVDAEGRVCTCGRHFQIAEGTGAYPVKVYAVERCQHVPCIVHRTGGHSAEEVNACGKCGERILKENGEWVVEPQP